MVDPLDICKICLRTDVKLQEIDKELQNFHYAVTDFALFHVDSRLCPECEYLLRKWHNFNQKCVKAGKILQLWHRNMIMGKTNRKPLSTLFSQVPQSKLKVYAQTVTQIYTHEEVEPSPEHENILPKQHNYDIKTEIEIEIPQVQIKDVAVKDEEIQGIVIENVAKNDIELINEYDNENDDINDMANDDTSLSSDDECLAAKKLRRTEPGQSKVKKEKIKRITKKCSKEKVKKKSTKEDINFENGTDLKTEENILAKLQNVDEDLNTVFVNWEKTSLKELPTVTYVKDRSTKRNVAKKKLVEKKGKKRRKDKKKGVVAKLKCLKADLENIWENCGKIVNYKEGLINPKERLRAELVSQFSSCGELKTEDGFVIDKEVVLGCFDRVSECLMKRLWRFMHGKATLESRAINTLKHIQNKYQNEHTYESVFTIEYLNTKEKVAEEFEKRRSYECFLNAKYRCEQCFLGFKYEAQMENHKNMHEESAGDFACPTCGVRHKSKKSLDSHSKSHEAVYKCKLCPLVTYYRYSMMNHYNQHEGMEYRCQLCDTTFRSKSALKTHCGLRHSGKNATDTQPGGTVPCVPCGLSFPTRPAYLKHARSTHNSTTYIAHKAKEGAPKKRPVHTCRVCNAVGTSIGWLTLHFRMEHPTADMSVLYADKHAHLCEICGKGYANIYNLRDHLAIHAGVRAHACAVCGARFHRAISLAQHRLTHQPPRRACPSCGKRFHSQSNLNNHMRGHTGDRRYKCNLCGKGFLHRNALNEHVRGVHYKLRRVRKRDGEKLMRNDGN